MYKVQLHRSAFEHPLLLAFPVRLGCAIDECGDPAICYRKMLESISLLHSRQRNLRLIFRNQSSFCTFLLISIFSTEYLIPSSSRVMLSFCPLGVPDVYSCNPSQSSFRYEGYYCGQADRNVCLRDLDWCGHAERMSRRTVCLEWRLCDVTKLLVVLFVSSSF